MAKQRLLIVDSDARSLRVLEVSLRKAGYSITVAVDGSDALNKVGTAPPDLIISDIHMPRMDGFTLASKVKENPEWAAIPFVFLSRNPTIEEKVKGLELGVDDFLTKPIFVKEVVTRVRILLQRKTREKLRQVTSNRSTFSGSLDDMPVVDLLQSIDASRKSGVLRLCHKDQEGGLYFRDGRVVDAQHPARGGAAAVFRMLTWSEGSFDFEFREVRRDDVVQETTQSLLLEGMHRLDEWGRLLEGLPSLDMRLEVNYRELAEQLADIPDDVNRVLRQFDAKTTILEVLDNTQGDDLEVLTIISKLFFDGLVHLPKVDQPKASSAAERSPLTPDREAAPAAEPVGPTAPIPTPTAEPTPSTPRDEVPRQSTHRSLVPPPAKSVSSVPRPPQPSAHPPADQVELPSLLEDSKPNQLAGDPPELVAATGESTEARTSTPAAALDAAAPAAQHEPDEQNQAAASPQLDDETLEQPQQPDEQNQAAAPPQPNDEALEQPQHEPDEQNDRATPGGEAAAPAEAEGDEASASTPDAPAEEPPGVALEDHEPATAAMEPRAESQEVPAPVEEPGSSVAQAQAEESAAESNAPEAASPSTPDSSPVAPQADTALAEDTPAPSPRKTAPYAPVVAKRQGSTRPPSARASRPLRKTSGEEDLSDVDEVGSEATSRLPMAIALFLVAVALIGGIALTVWRHSSVADQFDDVDRSAAPEVRATPPARPLAQPLVPIAEPNEQQETQETSDNAFPSVVQQEPEVSANDEPPAAAPTEVAPPLVGGQANVESASAPETAGTGTPSQTVRASAPAASQPAGVQASFSAPAPRTDETTPPTPQQRRTAYRLAYQAMLQAEQQPDQAFALAQQAVQLDPTRAEPWYVIAFVEHQRGNAAGARQALEQCLNGQGAVRADCRALQRQLQ